MAVGPRNYAVVRKVVESDVITSFYLRPDDGLPLAPFKPGQFLTLDLAGPDGQLVRRTYSLSCSAGVNEYYRISVKREPSGVGSGLLHESIEVGDTLTIHNPKGDFVLDSESPRPVVLLSGGVGLTPLLSMLHTLVEEDSRNVWFIHACNDGRVHAFGNEVRELISESKKAIAHFCYREPCEEDELGRDYDSTGFISKQLLQQLLPIDDYDVYLCGPVEFMRIMYDLLADVGVPEERIAYEFFSAQDQLKKIEPAVAPSNEAEVTTAADDGRYKVTFRKSDITANWTGDHGSLLEFAEAQGIEADFSCRAGVCNTCECGLDAGAIEYFEEPLSEPDQGRALICCSVPASDITLDI